MHNLIIATLVFAFCFGAALAGMVLHRKLPGDHLDSDSRDVIKLVMGLVGTLAALVLGLLIASSKNYYDTQQSELQQVAADVLLLDQTLGLYGPETREARDLVKQIVTVAHRRAWPASGDQPGDLDPAADRDLTNALNQKLLDLSPATEAQRLARSGALQIQAGIRHVRVLMFEQERGLVTWVLLAVQVFWVTMLFLAFGLLTRFHVTITAALMVGALSVAGATFLILELGEPFAGLLRVSDAPIVHALTRIGR